MNRTDQSGRTGHHEQTTRLKILLIEDNPEFAYNLQVRLSKQKESCLDVDCVRTLRCGLDALSDKHFDLILLDLTLPDSYGLETYAKIEPLAKDVPIVILTGWDNNRFALEAVKRGAEDYVVKGEVEGRMLVRLIQHAIERHRIKKELAQVSLALRETNLNLQRMTMLDPLTELYNRRGLQQALTRELEWAIRYKRSLLAMIVDIDYFKHFNDSLGYAVGDVLLREVAKTMQNLVRLTDHIARIGGDEFLILLPETPMDMGIKIAERIRLAIADEPFLLSGQKKVNVTASAGLVPVCEQTTSIDELLSKTHPYLKLSKQGGRNRVTHQDPKSKNGNGSNLSLQTQLEALREIQEFRAVKQPIVRLTDGEVVGYEMLSRLNSNIFPMPADFFRVASENNMLTLVDRHCFTVCTQASANIAPDMRCHVNLLPSTIIDVPIQSLIDSIPPEHPKEQFCFEISEQQIIGDPGYLLEAVERFREAGIQVAVDDVGFGHSCLESIIAFEPSIIKFDQKYVHGISTDNAKLRLLKRAFKMAEDLDAEVVAEGIEVEEDLKALQDIGVKYGQGFLLGRPA